MITCLSRSKSLKSNVECKKISEKMLQDIEAKLKALTDTSGIRPKLVSVSVGSEKDSSIYVKMQERTAEKIGVDFETVELAADTDEKTLLDVINRLNGDDTVTAAILQHPLPEGLDHSRIVSSFCFNKPSSTLL